jgi:hypothetical protein
MNSKKSAYSTLFLVTEPTLLKGTGSVFNIWGNYYGFNVSQTEEEADVRAIESDWGMVGEDFRKVVELSPAQ